MTIPKEQFNGKNFHDYVHNPIIDVGPPGSFDCKFVLDPATVHIKDQIFLYYSGIGDGSDSIGLTVSKNGFNFAKYSQNPVLTGRSPEVVYQKGLFYLFYVTNKDSGYYVDTPFVINLATSRDGYQFEPYAKNPVLVPGNAGEWDSHTVTTPRILYEGGTYYMVYAGDNTHPDYSKYFGLAASKDLVHWTKYPQNPIFERGKTGSWDEGGVWFGTIHKHADTYYLWYEGYGGGRNRDKDFDEQGHSQIGLATSKGTNLTDVFKIKQGGIQ